MYCRPDLKLLDPLNATQILRLGPRDFLTPYWHQWSGLNDRISVAAPAVAELVANRIDLAQDYSRRTFLRAESFLKWVVTQRHGLEVAWLEARAQRIRATGDVAGNDACLAYCDPSSASGGVFFSAVSQNEASGEPWVILKQ